MLPSIEYKRSLGRVIRLERRQRGFSSQESFADKCGLDRTYIGAIERGERNVSLENLVKIANELNLTVSKLFSKAENLENEWDKV